MQPKEGILEDRILRLFEEGGWVELEEHYRGLLRGDPSDARTTFRLANLLAYQLTDERKGNESLALYDTVWAHQWLRGLALNNKGVVLACRGETRAAIKTLRKAAESEGGCAPAFYNLGILNEKLGDTGSLPKAAFDFGLGPSGAKTEELARTYYQQALDSAWPETKALDRPLLLWMGDLKPGFGSEPVRQTADVKDSHSLFAEATALLGQGQWRAAISKLDAAADLHPDAFRERIEAPRTAAMIEIVRQHREEARKKWAQGDHDGANRTLGELLELGAALPDRAFADEILLAGINDLAQQIRIHKPESGWESLQQLITAARQRIEGLGEEKEEEGVVTPQAAPPEGGDGEEPADRTVASQTPVLRGAGREDPQREESRRYIQSVCRTACGQQIKHLIETRALDDAIQLLDFAQLQWFAADNVHAWRRQVYTAQAERLWARGQDAWNGKIKDWPAARDTWLAARRAAVLSGDSLVTDRYDTLLDGLAASLPKQKGEELSPEHRQERDREELRRIVTQLAADPGNPRLKAQRDALLGQWLAVAQGALEARLWQAAGEIANKILADFPDHLDAPKILRAANQGIVEQRVRQAEEALERGDDKAAGELLKQALDLDPDHARALELQREVKAARPPGESPYDMAYLAFKGKAYADDPEGAHEHVVKLRKLDPDSAQTQEALDWYATALVRRLRGELEENRTPEASTALELKLKPLLAMCPKFRPALDLREELRRAQKPTLEEKRREASVKLLGEATDELLKKTPDPDVALGKIREIQKLRVPNLQAEAQERQEQALTLLRDQIDDRLREGEDGEDLFKVYERWAPEAAKTLRQELERRKKRPQEERKLKGELARLRQLSAEDPAGALREIDSRLSRFDPDEDPLGDLKEAELRSLRQEIQGAMRDLTWLARLLRWIPYRRQRSEPDRGRREGAKG